MPNSNYCAFEDWVVPILDQMVAEQEGPGRTKWSPSSVISRLGKEIDNEDSVYYWCHKVSLCRSMLSRLNASRTTSRSSALP